MQDHILGAGFGGVNNTETFDHIPAFIILGSSHIALAFCQSFFVGFISNVSLFM